MYTLKYTILLKYLKKNHCQYTKQTLKLHLPFIFGNFYTKIKPKSDKNNNLRQNTVCLEQQIYASPENFTPLLHVMHMAFRRSEYTWVPRNQPKISQHGKWNSKDTPEATQLSKVAYKR